MWLGRSSGEEMNMFGVDFVFTGRQWNKWLCEKDSDDDGWTNGEELGFSLTPDAV